MDLEKANGAPRIHEQLMYHDKLTCTYSDEKLIGGGTVKLEEYIVEYMESLGHAMEPVEYTGSCQAISVQEGGSSAVSDVRKHGAPAAA